MRDQLFARLLCGSVSILALASLSTPADAQQSSPVASAQGGSAAPSTASAGNTVEEVFVTAQRRSEPLQKVPVAVSAVQGDTIRALGVNTSEVISTVVP